MSCFRFLSFVTLFAFCFVFFGCAVANTGTVDIPVCAEVN